MDDVLLGHVAEHASECPRVGVDVDAVEAHRPGRRPVKPAIASNRVVLPAPLGPTIATSSPAERVNDPASRSVTSPRLRTRTRRHSSLTSMRTPWAGTPARDGKVASGVLSSVAIPFFVSACGHGSSSCGHAFSIGRESDRSWVDFCRSFRPGTESNLGRGPVSWAAPSGAGRTSRAVWWAFGMIRCATTRDRSLGRGAR